ncbi:SRPBCC domain-containing protein [Hylemonella gracilis]|jgi:uncharacterized protein YndB with AHSA1/START domain|uniref:SRPBCC domain-containing protein n=1 Tax=Hylemonella gracilis TaxID=80880 RepID=A0A4P6UJL0_9BURK|nr:SRPBCC domain-containing protein [Hylemonella gracilis]QBK04624.1 SRPBCC domain-containing protein [Hylemonella gracilis]
MNARTDALPPAENELALTRVFDAPRPLVFRAWTDPEQMARWAAPRGFSRGQASSDVRVGGAYRACIRSPEGQDHWVHGVYREIVEPERLVMTHGWLDDQGQPGPMTLVTVTFEELGPRQTRMNFLQTGFASTASREGHHEGWASSFEQLVELLDQLTA